MLWRSAHSRNALTSPTTFGIQPITRSLTRVKTSPYALEARKWRDAQAIMIPCCTLIGLDLKVLCEFSAGVRDTI